MYRRYGFPTIWRDMERMQRQMDHLFYSFSPLRHGVGHSYPSVNLWTNQDGAVVTAEVPGVSPKDMEIKVVGETLTVSGERQPAEVSEKARYHRQERGFAKFTRSIPLPFPVETGKVEASFQDGVLQITLPRLEASKPRKIAVKTA